MNEFCHKGNVSDQDFLIHVLNNLPKKYDVILNELENHLTTTRDDSLTINSIHKKLITGTRKLKVKKKKRSKKKKHWVYIMNNTNSNVRNVARMATNLATEDALKIKMKKKKIIRKQKDMKVKIEKN